MLKSENLDILNLSVKLNFEDDGITSTFRTGMNRAIGDMLTDEESKKISKNLSEMAKIINDAIMRDFAYDFSDFIDDLSSDDLSDDFNDFINKINEDRKLRDALDTLMEAIKR